MGQNLRTKSEDKRKESVVFIIDGIHFELSLSIEEEKQCPVGNKIIEIGKCCWNDFD